MRRNIISYRRKDCGADHRHEQARGGPASRDQGCILTGGSHKKDNATCRGAQHHKRFPAKPIHERAQSQVAAERDHRKGRQNNSGLRVDNPMSLCMNGSSGIIMATLKLITKNPSHKTNTTNIYASPLVIAKNNFF